MADLGIPLKPREQVRLGPLTIESATRRLVHDDGREEILEPRVIQLLVVLVKADGAILSRDDLVDLCWDGRAIGDDAVFRALSRLRRATEGIGAGVFRLETIPKAGYRLVLAPDPVTPPPADPPRPPEAASLSRRGALLVAASAAAGGLAFALLRPQPVLPSHRHRLAVLSFKPLAGTPDYVAAGLSEEILDEASRIAGLEVIGSISTQNLPPAKRNPRGAADLLGASLVLHGTVQATTDNIRLTAHLVGAPDATPIWSQTVSGPLGEVYRLQQALLQRVARTAQIIVSAPPPRALHPEAVRLYLQAQARRLMTPQDDAGAEPLLRRAVARDPNFAEAWSVLGGITFLSAMMSWSRAPHGVEFDRDHMTAAVFAARRATALKPELPAPFIVVANVMGYLGDWAECHHAAHASIARGGHPLWSLLRLGQQRRSIENARREAVLNPLAPHVHANLADLLTNIGDYEASVVIAERAFAREQTPFTLYGLLVPLIALRRSAQARQLLASYAELLERSLPILAPMTRAYFLHQIGLGPRPDPDEFLAQVDRGDASPADAAVAFARIGAMRHASRMLDRMGAYEVPTIPMIFQHQCAGLRKLPAFGSLMQRIGLATFWRQTGHHPDFDLHGVLAGLAR